MQQEEQPVDPLRMALRNVGATLAGIVVGVVIIALVQQMGHKLYPSSLSSESSPEEFARFLETASFVQLSFPLLAYFLGTFAGTYLAHRLGRTNRPVNSISAGAVFVIAAVLTFRSLPHPVWFIAATLVLMGVGTWLGYRLARRYKVGKVMY